MGVLTVPKLDLGRLTDFLYRAKQATWIGDGKEAKPTRPGSKDYVFREGAFTYRDSYFGIKSFGFQSFAGQEVVWLNRTPVWAMNYFGRVPEFPKGIKTEQERRGFAKEVFKFLKAALKHMPKRAPLRGPEYWTDESDDAESKKVCDVYEFAYCTDYSAYSFKKNRIMNFEGIEEITASGPRVNRLMTVFELAYHGGLLVPKTALKKL